MSSATQDLDELMGSLAVTKVSCLLVLQRISPRKGPPRFLTEGRTSMTKSGLACVYCVVLSFLSEGFLYKDQIEELFIIMLICMYSQHITLSTFSLISHFWVQHTFQRHDLAYLCWKCRQTPNPFPVSQSVSQSIQHMYSLFFVDRGFV